MMSGSGGGIFSRNGDVGGDSIAGATSQFEFCKEAARRLPLLCVDVERHFENCLNLKKTEAAAVIHSFLANMI